MKVDYQKTFIYKLCCRDPTISQIYIGHSTNYKNRNQCHKNTCNNINHREYNNYKYRFIRQNGGYENWIMIKLYDYPCDSKREAEAEECKNMIELNATLNMVKSFITKENKKEYQKEYYQNNKEELKKNKEEYYENNKTEILENKKKYRQNNKTEINEKQKKHYENNKTEINEKRKVKVKCEFCGFELQKNTLKTHQKSQKCLKFKEFIDLE